VGDAGLWYLIADANEINKSPEAQLTAHIGQSLCLPNVVRVEHSNATTFKPYTCKKFGGIAPLHAQRPHRRRSEAVMPGAQILKSVNYLKATREKLIPKN
jgi:hypothetical protein